MNTLQFRLCSIIALSFFLTVPAKLQAQGTAFTYQGRLTDPSGNPVSGPVDLQIKMFPAPTGGSLLGSPLMIPGVTVNNGVFTTTIDFGAQESSNLFTGQVLWMEISDVTHEVVFPRQQITPTPYAILAASALNANTAFELTGNLPAGQLSGTIASSNLPASPVFSGTVTASNFSGSGATLTALNPANLSAGTANVSILGNAATATTATTAASANSVAAANITAGTANISITGNAATATTASNVTGNIADSQLSANVAFLNGTNTFAGTNSFAGVVIATNASNVIAGTFTGNLTGSVTGNASTATSAISATAASSAMTATTATNFSGPLSGDVTGTQGATVVSTVGGVTAANVASGANAANGATSTNTVGAIVARDASGNFAAGSITLNGNLHLPGPTATVFSGGGTLLYSDGNDNFFAGPSAGNVTTSGNRNTANGYQALQSDTSGSANTVSGFEALNNNTSGSGNTVYGYQTMQANAGGSENTAIGLDALLNNTIGNSNIALGDHAGFNIGFSSSPDSYNIDIGNSGVAGDSGVIRIGTPGIQTNTTIAGTLFADGGGLTNLNASQLTGGTISLAQLPGAVVTNNEPGVTFSNLTLNGSLNLPYNNGNTALGSAALVNNFSGSGNTANGALALYNNYAGSNNTANGLGSLGNSGGSYNTASGFNALGNNTSGSYNTAVGANSLYGFTNSIFPIVPASSNTAVGFGALYNDVSGNNNIALGYQAGLNLTSDNNIDIGNPGLAGESNIVRIGNQQTTAFIAGTTLYTDIYSNFFAGPGAGDPGTGGEGNLAVGYQALHNNNYYSYDFYNENEYGTGNYERVLYEGYYAGNQNTANGNQALYNNVAGSYNTANGYQALYNNNYDVNSYYDNYDDPFDGGYYRTHLINASRV
jgi:hypothetical protein